MALSTETIEVLYMRNGLGKFHLPAAPLQHEYDHCIYDFARAIEAEVRKEDEQLIRRLLEFAEMVTDEGPDGEGWRSKELSELIGDTYERLEKAP